MEAVVAGMSIQHVALYTELLVVVGLMSLLLWMMMLMTFEMRGEAEAMKVAK